MHRKPNLHLIILFLIFSINGYAQIRFEKGYFIGNDDKKVECLIKNIDWKFNPTKISYKLIDDSEPQNATIKEIKEFGIYNDSKFIRRTVGIDRSSSIVRHLSTVRKAILHEEELFLKVLIEGEGCLYSFRDRDIIRYFYRKNESEIKQLIYKEYISVYDKINTNKDYIYQLWNDLKCEDITLSKTKKIGYNKRQLTDFFREYNECKIPESTKIKDQKKENKFNLNIRPGLTYSSLVLNNNYPISKPIDFKSKYGLRFGVEAEFLLPFNKNKWSIIIEPTYQSFTSTISYNNHEIECNYKSVELPIGLRYYVYLNDNSKIFVNGSFVFDFVADSEIIYGSQRVYDVASSDNLGFGIGFKHKDKYSLEFRYQANRDLLEEYKISQANYNSLSLVFGYTLF